MLRKVRVLMVTDTLQVGGAEQVAVDIANTLDRDVHEVAFCATRSDGLLRGGLRDDVDVHILGRSATWDVAKMLEFARYVREEGFDIVHSHGRGTMRLVALVGSLGLIGAQHVFHDHFGRLHIDRSAGPGLRVPLRHGIDAYIGVEARLCRWAVETVGLPPERVFLVRSGVQVDRFTGATPIDLRREFDIDDDRLVLVMVANFRPQKDHPTLFRALAELPERDRERLHVVICGSTTADPGYYQGCMAMLERLGVAHLVTTIGVRDDAPALMAGADAGVFSSKNESGPLVLLEYMASGLPFVATETGEIAHAVRDDGVGILVEPRDYLALADALSTLLAMSPQDRTAMGLEGRRVVQDRFDQHVVVREVEHIYRRLLGTGGRGSSVQDRWGDEPRAGQRPVSVDGRRRSTSGATGGS
jgi:glycosyltransferase involved in cell wall biosynthesis